MTPHPGTPALVWMVKMQFLEDSRNFQEVSLGFLGFPGLNPGFPGLNPAFAGFQNGFSSPTGLPGGFGDPVSQAANSGFLSGGNIDFSKMESLVKRREEQQSKDGVYTGNYGGKNGKPA